MIARFASDIFDANSQQSTITNVTINFADGNIDIKLKGGGPSINTIL